MTLRFRLPLYALALALPAPLFAQAAQEFQLPPNPTPTATPRVQGPVDEEGGVVPIRPRAIPTAAPSPSPAAVQPAEVPTPSPAATTPAPRTTARPATRPSATATRATDITPPLAPRETTPLDQAAQPAPLPPASTIAPTATPTPTSAQSATDASQGALPWPWLFGALGLLVLAGGAAAWWRRKQAAAPPPLIERPAVNTAPTQTQAHAGPAITLRAEAIKLTRSFAFATLDYRLTIINRTQQAMTDLAISSDLVSAHGNAPMEEQVALPDSELPTRHSIARLSPGQSQQIAGQVQLPLGQAQIIRQGQLPLLVPLLRLRVDGTGAEPLVRTFVIGLGQADGGRLQPFRLDEQPQSYQQVGQRELA